MTAPPESSQRIRLNEIAIDLQTLQLCISYHSWGRSGKIQIHLYRLPRSRSEQPIRQIGDKGGVPGKAESIDWAHLPGSVRDDALRWLQRQIERAQAGGRGDSASHLSVYRELLG